MDLASKPQTETAKKRRGFGLLRLVTRLLRWIVLLGLGLAALSILWVLAYRWIDPPYTALMGKRLWEEHQRNGAWHWNAPEWADARDISPNMYKAVIAGEDQRFVEHWGFDLDAIQAAAKWNMKHKRKRGASTITQQVAKNVFLWENRSWLRKGLEAWFTCWIELLWPKERILEVYVNVAEMGPGVFGVGDAARLGWRTTPDRLSPAQAALLASALPLPRTFSASRPKAFHRSRQRAILADLTAVEIPDGLKRRPASKDNGKKR